MRAKNVAFDITYIDLQDKPDWFLGISPHGKVPVLKVDDEILFESNAIAEYLDETVAPPLHPEDPIARARNRAWTDYAPSFADALSSVTYAKTRADMEAAQPAARKALVRLDAALGDGPYFNGPSISLVDAAYAPFLQRFAFCDRWLRTGLLVEFAKVKAWTDMLLADPRVTGAVVADIADRFIANYRRRGFYVASLIDETAASE
ncbi:MAG: glutathione S-transferase family protein [Alphaproteobacteria bacterium]|nr:glutathione S-transferase family protein [Alphaproteobacteria bacterium]